MRRSKSTCDLVSLAVVKYGCSECSQGSLDMSAEEMALCSSIADFRNSMYNFEEPWSAVDVRGVTDKILMQLFDVRSLPTASNLLLAPLFRVASMATLRLAQQHALPHRTLPLMLIHAI